MEIENWLPIISNDKHSNVHRQIYDNSCELFRTFDTPAQSRLDVD